MDLAISDLALDLGIFALDKEIENGSTRESFRSAPNFLREEAIRLVRVNLRGVRALTLQDVTSRS